MQYKVYHAVEPTFGFGRTPKFPEEYKLVALVECKDLEDVFRATNHITEDWTENPEVIDLYANNIRSTSVGDVVEDENSVFNYCDHVGWKELEVA